MDVSLILYSDNKNYFNNCNIVLVVRKYKILTFNVNI